MQLDAANKVELSLRLTLQCQSKNTRRPTEMIDPESKLIAVLVPTSSVKYQSLQRRLLRSLPLRWSLR